MALCVFGVTEVSGQGQGHVVIVGLQLGGLLCMTSVSEMSVALESAFCDLFGNIRWTIDAEHLILLKFYIWLNLKFGTLEHDVGLLKWYLLWMADGNLTGFGIRKL